MQTLLRPLGVSGVEPYASHLNAKPDELVQMFGADQVEVVVVGGETQPTWKMIGGMLQGHIAVVDEWR